MNTCEPKSKVLATTLVHQPPSILFWQNDTFLQLHLTVTPRCRCCEGIEWSKATLGWLPNRHIIQLCTSYFSASPLGTNLFSLVWSKHSLDYDCFAHQYKPCPREVLFSKLSFLSSALFWSKLDHDHCWQPCRPGLPEADISFAILRRCRSGPAFCNTDFSPLPCNVFEGL